jgi:hypothetical protein
VAATGHCRVVSRRARERARLPVLVLRCSPVDGRGLANRDRPSGAERAGRRARDPSPSQQKAPARSSTQPGPEGAGSPSAKVSPVGSVGQLTPTARYRLTPTPWPATARRSTARQRRPPAERPGPAAPPDRRDFPKFRPPATEWPHSWSSCSPAVPATSRSRHRPAGGSRPNPRG